ncbi:MAG: MOSC domain-containing protein [Eubacteriales bacterium]
MPTVIAIQISEKKGAPRHIVNEGLCRENWGLEGDAHAGSGNRQISLFGLESIRKMELLGMEGLCTGRFAENITTEGINLYELPVGSRFTIGCCEFEVTQIGKACHQNCAIFRQQADCVMPREGIFARVIKGGRIRTGDEISLLP